MKKFTRNTLQLAVLTALTGISAAAYAGFPGSPVANEMPTSQVISAIPQVWTTITAFTPSASTPLQISVNLSGNTKFTSAPKVVCTITALSAASYAYTALAVTARIVPKLSLGGAGSTQAVFSSVTGTKQFRSCWVSANTATVTGTHASVVETITFKYGTLASSTTNGNLITWKSGVSAAAVTNKTVTAKVVSGFMKVGNGALLASSNTIAWNTTLGSVASTGTIGTKGKLTTYMNTTSASITFAGTPLASVARVYLVSGGKACTTAGKLVGTSAKVGAASVTFNVTANQVSGGLRGCFSFSGTTAIPAGSITAQLAGKAKTNYSLPTVASANVLTIVRDGTTLVAPLVNVPAGWISRLVLNNRSSAAATYTVTATSETGTVATLTGAAASGSLAANTTSVIDLSTLLTTTGTARTSLLIAVAGTNADIDGLYQLVNAATGNLSNYTLLKQ